MSRGYGALLDLPGTRWLLSSSLIARLPAGMESLSIVLLVRQRTGSFAAAGAVVGAYTIAAGAASPLRGTAVDRYGPRPPLVICAVLSTASLGVLVLTAGAHGATAAMAAVAALAGALLPPVDACVRTAWPRVAPDAATLETAYALEATSQELIWTTGPLLVAAVVAVASPSAAVLVVAAIGLGGTLLFISSPLTRRDPEHAAAARAGSALASRNLRALLAVSLLIGFGLGAFELGIPALAVHAGSRGWAAVPLTLLAGVGYAPALACVYALVNRLAPPGVAAEAFAWNSASLIAGVAAGSAVSGPVIQSAGFPYAFAIGCAASAAAAMLAAGVRRWLRAPAMSS